MVAVVRNDNQSTKVLLHGSEEFYWTFVWPQTPTIWSKNSFCGQQNYQIPWPPNQHTTCPTLVRTGLKESLMKMLTAVDQCSVSRKQKLKLYRLGIYPRLNWLLTTHEFPLSWIERQLEASATQYLKKWAGMVKSANPNLLYLSKQSGGLNLPAITTLYKQLQVSRQSQLLLSSDPCVRKIAEKNFQSEMIKQKKFSPALEVWNNMQVDPSLTRKALRVTSKGGVKREDDDTRLGQLQSLQKQGHMTCSALPDMSAIWAEAVQRLPDEQFKFTLNAALDCTPPQWKSSPLEEKSTRHLPALSKWSPKPGACA